MLGVTWTVLQPLAMILIYTLVFSKLMKTRLNGIDGEFSYSIHLCAGILTWGLFSEVIQRSQSMFIDNANLLKKISFPKLSLPIIVVTTALLNFAIVLGLFIIFLVISGNFPGIILLSIIPLIAIQILFSIGLGVTLGVLNVFFRDTGQLTGLLLQFWFWATPIVYPASILPDWLMPWMNLNPMYHLILGYQNIFVDKNFPNWNNISLLSILSAVIALFAVRLFHRHSGEIVDEL